MAEIRLMPAAPEDYPEILRLNEAEVPHVNSISAATLAHLHEQSCYCKVAKNDTAVVAFLVVLAETADYGSPNFGFFKNRYPSFAYVDRIFVSEEYQGRGIGSLLYSDLIEELQGAKPFITCEVNVAPPNPGSIAFHEHLGFVQVAQQDTEGGSKRVALMVRDLSPCGVMPEGVA